MIKQVAESAMVPGYSILHAVTDTMLVVRASEAGCVHAQMTFYGEFVCFSLSLSLSL